MLTRAFGGEQTLCESSDLICTFSFIWYVLCQLTQCQSYVCCIYC